MPESKRSATTSSSISLNADPVGYGWAIQEYSLSVMPPDRITYRGRSGQRRERIEDGRVVVVLSPGYKVGPSITDHLEFALKHEGVSLEVLAAVFKAVDSHDFERQLATALAERPTGHYLRVLWFLYEYIAERRIAIGDARTGNYVPVLDPERYFTGSSRKSRRHRVADNLLGNAAFCPTVRKTALLREYIDMDLAREAADLVSRYDEDALARATNYLYTKETRSSFGIEGERPSPSRAERFASLLRSLPRLERLDEGELVRLQNLTVDPRFADRGYRKDQVYVGEQLDLSRQQIHYVAPRPQDVASMMEGLLSMAGRLRSTAIDPVVYAAALSFGFVLVHPFSDGNGRLHRMLIHYALATSGFAPPGVVLPISAIMLQRRREYDACLESFSKPLLERVEYEESSDGLVTVKNETALFYRYFDATPMAEALYRWVEETVRKEFRYELDFVVGFREARAEIDRIVDLPDRLANLFIKVTLQNQGRLSEAKRKTQFRQLSDNEIRRMERVVEAKLRHRVHSGRL